MAILPTSTLRIAVEYPPWFQNYDFTQAKITRWDDVLHALDAATSIVLISVTIHSTAGRMTGEDVIQP